MMFYIDNISPLSHLFICFFFQTIGYDPLVNAEESAKYNIEWLELEQIWSRADYITVHVPLIPPTRSEYRGRHLVVPLFGILCKKSPQMYVFSDLLLENSLFMAIMKSKLIFVCNIFRSHQRRCVWKVQGRRTYHQRSAWRNR